MLRYALAFVAAGTVANAQEPKYFYTAQECGDVEDIVESILPFGEEPLFTGTINQFGIEQNRYTGRMVFGVNQDTGTWTMISVWADGTACYVPTGMDFEPFGG